MSKLARLLSERMRMLREDASAVAQVVEEAFAGKSELDDDLLDPQMRQVFYDLQDEKILNVRREEYTIDGHARRGYFWSIDGSRRLDRWAPLVPKDPDAAFYEALGERAWERRQVGPGGRRL